MKTDINDIILAWAIRRQILLGQESINDLTAELVRLLHLKEGGESCSKCEELQDFAIWLTGCGYNFCQHDYFIKQRDKLLKDAG